MIRSVELKNFQSHKHTKIDFSQGVNAIVGLSDTGKTAILRAINWAFTNRPAGDEFLSHWGGVTSVRIDLIDGVAVERIKGPGDNSYILHTEVGTPKEHVQIFRAFGQAVPDEIQKVFHLNAINIQDQMAGPFLLGSSPGEVAQTLNEAVDLQDIDSAVSNIRKHKMEVERKLKEENARADDIQESLNSLSYIDGMEADVVYAEEIEKSLATCQRESRELETSLSVIRRLDEKNIKLSKLMEAKPDLEQCLKDLDQIEKTKNEEMELFDLITGIQKHEQKISELEPLIPLEKEHKQAMKMWGDVEELRSAIVNIGGKINYLNSLAQVVRNLEEEVKRRNKEFQEAMPNICPLCGRS